MEQLLPPTMIGQRLGRPVKLIWCASQVLLADVVGVIFYSGYKPNEFHDASKPSRALYLPTPAHNLVQL